MIFTKKNKDGVRTIRAIKYKNYVAAKYAQLWRGLRQIDIRDGTTSIDTSFV